MPSHFLEGKKIIVSGAGFAGLSFIIALRQNWNPAFKPPQITIYEREGRHLPRSRQGYSLSLHGFDEDGGLVAARDIGVLDDMMKHAVSGTDSIGGFRIWSSSWAQMLSVRFDPYKDLPTSGMRIIRNDMREVCVSAAEKLYPITWNTMVTSAEKLPNGRIRTHVRPSESGREADSFTDDCDLLIAADGAHSKIRASFRPGDNLEYAGAVQMGGVARFPNGLPELVTKNWGMVISGEGVGCFVSPVDATGVVWALSFLEPQSTKKYDTESTKDFEAFKDEALTRGHMIQEPFQTIVHATEQHSLFRFPARDKKPFPHAGDENLKGVVFLGDTNHAVSPFAGNGANMALKDGVDLARQLCNSQSMEEALEAYDKLALPRAEKTLKQSHQRIAHAHCTGWYYYAMRGMLLAGSTAMFLMGRV
ncbi:monooxygenase [Pochonia chlamydosporia 170]|uniref:Monooxygenase n=1 Tax=Pochonia chlamydosporia 170 TaxID=1380566 RepID=A0A179FZE5_METCM|nr:monooxygenase [Pochonia chlamydosporia 170]OAQ71045.1 monooxygenase [Pochonia chlamydosporia 170]